MKGEDRSKLIQIIPADNYYFIVPPPEAMQKKEPPIVWRVACWGLYEDGSARGLVPVDSALVGAPPRSACVHFSELPEDFKKLALKTSIPASYDGAEWRGGQDKETAP